MTHFDRSSGRVTALFGPFSGIRIPTGLVPFLLAAAVGVAAGLGSVVMTEAVEGLSDLLQGDLAGALNDLAGRWTIILVPAVVAIPEVYLITRFSREARALGVPRLRSSSHLHLPGFAFARCAARSIDPARQGPS